MRIVGIHPIVAREPVHLVEIEVDSADLPVDWVAITQPIQGLDRSDWQVPYDDCELGEDGRRWCFFFHYLDPSRPLSSSRGDLVLPPESPVPERLRFIRYEEP